MKTENYFMRIRDLTDDEWKALPKEEILQLYKNCYKMLMEFINSKQTAIVDINTPFFCNTGVEIPVYDESYLNECIEKAKPNLSKIKDVDKELAEIRGPDEYSSDAMLGDKLEDILRH